MRFRGVEGLLYKLPWYNIFVRYDILFFLLLILFSLPADAKHLYKEAEYQKFWCEKRGGVMEYKLNDKTRVDCLTDKYAAELDFAPKWAECIGQAVYYGAMTNRTPACVLIMERGFLDEKYLNRLQKTAEKTGVKTFTLEPSHVRDPSLLLVYPRAQNQKRR